MLRHQAQKPFVRPIEVPLKLYGQVLTVMIQPRFCQLPSLLRRRNTGLAYPPLATSSKGRFYPRGTQEGWQARGQRA